jgi:hypothetical protein
MNSKRITHKKDEIAKKIPTTLFHYDSVYNTIQFIRHGSLLSRNYMMQKGIPLTPQLSDIIDIEQNIFDSIFLESQYSLKAYMNYGPICMHISSKIFENNRFFPNGRFIKSNPEEWDKLTKLHEKYSELSADLDGESLVISNTSGFIPLRGHIEKISIISSKQERQKAFHRKNHFGQNRWGKSETGNVVSNFDETAKLNIEFTLAEAGFENIPVEIETNEKFFWKSKQSNWMEMMYFPSKLFSYDKEINIVYNKRRYNFPKKERSESLMRELKELYETCYNA